MSPRTALVLLFNAVIVIAAVAPARALDALPPDRSLSGHTAGVMCVRFLPDGQHAVTGSRDRTVKVWDLKAGRVIRTLEGHRGQVLDLAVSPDGARVASTGGDQTIRVWDVSNGNLVGLLEGHTGLPIGLKYLTNGTLLSGAGDGLRLWDVEKEELIWKGGEGVSQFAASADGRRVAVTRYSDGVHEVWDVPGRRRVRTLGGEGSLRAGLAIAPDGSDVYAHDSADPRWVKRWSVDTGKEVPFAGAALEGHRMEFSKDGSLFVMTSGLQGGGVVRDGRTGRTLRDLEGSKEIRQGHMAYAFSPDGKTLLATTAVFLPQMEPAHTERGELLLVYDLSDLRAGNSTLATGAKAGKLSWEELPVKVKLLSGEVVDWDAYKAPPDERGLPRPMAAGSGFDVMLNGSAAFLHRSAGLFEEVLLEPDAGFTSAADDGQHVWVGSRRMGILVLDRMGKTIARVGADRLPPFDNRLLLHALAPGRVLAVGLAGESAPAKGSGWCATVDASAGAGPPRVNVFFREDQLPAAWSEGTAANAAPFVPGWISEPPAPPPGGGADARRRVVWVGCRMTPAADAPVLRVYPDVPSAEAYNIGGPNQKRQRHRPVAIPDHPRPYWLSAGEVMFHNNSVERAVLGPTYMDWWDKRVVVFTAWPNENCDGTPFLPVDGQVYVPGKRWHRIDPKTLDVEDVGPGLRVDGTLVGDEVRYFVSGVMGPAAMTVGKGRLFRLSVDPAHPLPVAATLDPPPRGKPVPEGGVVDFANGMTIFYCGDGGLRFSSGKLRPDRSVTHPYLNPRAGLDAELVRTRVMIQRIAYPGEKERLGLSPDQLRRINTLREAPVPVDAERFAGLFDAWDRAAEGPAKATAAAPLFAGAKNVGTQDTASRQGYVDGFRAVVTPRQWKLLNYEIPTPADK